MGDHDPVEIPPGRRAEDPDDKLDGDDFSRLLGFELKDNTYLALGLPLEPPINADVPVPVQISINGRLRYEITASSKENDKTFDKGNASVIVSLFVGQMDPDSSVEDFSVNVLNPLLLDISITPVHVEPQYHVFRELAESAFSGTFDIVPALTSANIGYSNHPIIVGAIFDFRSASQAYNPSVLRAHEMDLRIRAYRDSEKLPVWTPY